MFRCKKVDLCNLLYTVLLIVGISLLTVPAYANDCKNTYSFSFEYGNMQESEVIWKNTEHATTVTCTECECISSYSFSAKICSKGGGYTQAKSLREGQTAIFYEACKFNEQGVYIKAWLNSDDIEVYKGIWEPDNINY